jgi:hypothetical protein
MYTQLPLVNDYYLVHIEFYFLKQVFLSSRSICIVGNSQHKHTTVSNKYINNNYPYVSYFLKSIHAKKYILSLS